MRSAEDVTRWAETGERPASWPGTWPSPDEQGTDSYERTSAAQALDVLGHLFAVWHNRFSDSELDAIGKVRHALRREFERGR